MAFIFINEKTGKKEKHWQCRGCLEWIPYSEENHKCKTREQEIAGLMWS